MSIVDSLLTDEITIVTTSVDINGVQTETETTGVKARVEDKVRMIRNQEGQEAMSNGFIMVESTATIEYEDLVKITNIAGDSQLRKDKKYGILKIGRAHNPFDNLLHYEVWI